MISIRIDQGEGMETFRGQELQLVDQGGLAQVLVVEVPVNASPGIPGGPLQTPPGSVVRPVPAE